MTSGASARLTTIRLPDKSEQLEKLPDPIEVQIHRLKDKIVTDATGRAWVTHLCDTAAQVTSEGPLEAWEDLRLILLDGNQEPIPGHIYGKVTRVTPLEDGRFEVLVNFTSVPAEIYRTFRHDPERLERGPEREGRTRCFAELRTQICLS